MTNNPKLYLKNKIIYLASFFTLPNLCYAGTPHNHSKEYHYNTSTYNVWLEPYFSGSKQRRIGNAPGYRASTVGSLFGAENEISATFKLGAGAGYAFTKQKSLLTSQTHADINNYIAMLYGTNKYEHNIALDWTISGGQNYYNAYRLVQQSPTIIASSNYVGSQYSIHGALNKRYNFGTFDVIPQVNANLVYARLPEYTETNAGALNNTVPEDISTLVTLGTGVKAEWPSLKNQHNVVSEIHALVYYDVNTQMFNLSPSFETGAPALSTTATTYRLTGKIGASFKVFASKHVSIKTEYDLQLKNSYYNNILFLIFKYIF